MQRNKYYSILTNGGSILQGLFIREVDDYIIFGEYLAPQILKKTDIKNWKLLNKKINTMDIEREIKE